MTESIKKIINARYASNGYPESRLEIEGPFDKKTIDEVIKKQPPYTFSQRNSDRIWEASFIVSDPRAASELVNMINKKLENYGFFINYVGPKE